MMGSYQATPCRLAGTLLTLAITLVPLSAWSVSLSGAYELARKNDRQWRTAQAKLRDAEELIPLARGQLLPQVSISASKSHVQQQQMTGSNTTPLQSYPADSQVLSVRQPLLRLRQVRAVEQANAQVEQAALLLRSEEQQLGIRVVVTYLDALLALDRRRLIDAQLALVSNRLAAAQAGLRAGQGTRNDVDDARSELDRIKAQAIQVDQGIQVSRKQVELIIGVDPQQFDVLDLTTFDRQRMEIPALAVALEFALRENPQLLASREEVRVATSVLRQANANHLPTLDLVAQAGKSTGENSFFAATSTRSVSVGLQFTLPLYAGGTIAAQVRQLSARLEQASESLEQFANKLRIEVQTEHNALVQGRALMDALKTAVSSAEEAVASSRRGQQAGVRTLLDILRAESLLFQAQLDLSQARYNYIASWVKLQALMGSLRPDMIPKVAALFGLP